MTYQLVPEDKRIQMQPFAVFNWPEIVSVIEGVLPELCKGLSAEWNSWGGGLDGANAATVGVQLAQAITSGKVAAYLARRRADFEAEGCAEYADCALPDERELRRVARFFELCRGFSVS